MSMLPHYGEFREVGNLPYASPTTRLSSAFFRCDVTIMLERQTRSLLSNDPLKKSIPGGCCRGCNIDAIDAAVTVIEAEKPGYVTATTGSRT